MHPRNVTLLCFRLIDGAGRRMSHWGLVEAVDPIVCLTDTGRGQPVTCLLQVTAHKYAAAANNLADPMRAFDGRMFPGGK